MTDRTKRAEEVWERMEKTAYDRDLLSILAAALEQAYREGADTRMHYVNESILQRKRAEAAEARIKELENMTQRLQEVMERLAKEVGGVIDMAREYIGNTNANILEFRAREAYVAIAESILLSKSEEVKE